MTRSANPSPWSVLAVVSVFASAACDKDPPAAPPPSAAPAAPAAAPAPPPPAAPAPAAAAPPAAPAPRVELSGEHFVVTAALTAPAAIPGATTLAVRAHATAGFHMNELYPTILEVQPTGASVEAPRIRLREKGRVSQQEVALDLPVQVTAADAVVRGTLKFAVCSESNCVPQEQAFAVVLPH